MVFHTCEKSQWWIRRSKEAIPLYVARAQCSFLADETMEVKEDGGEGRKKKKKGEKKTSKKKR